MNKYSTALQPLIQYGDEEVEDVMERYVQLGIGPEHIPELIRMATDEDLLWAEPESAEVYAPQHACQALLYLKATRALEPLMVALFPMADDIDTGNSEWLLEEVAKLFGKLADPSTLDQLERYYLTHQDCEERQYVCIQCFEEIATAQPGLRQTCIDKLVTQLEQYAHSDPEVNASLANALCEIKAKETMPLIRRAYAADRVDPGLMGEVEEAEYYMGLRTELPSEPRSGGWGFWPDDDDDDEDEDEDDTDLLPPAPLLSKNVGRNEPCPCGSGKKFKKCCLDKGTFLIA